MVQLANRLNTSAPPAKVVEYEFSLSRSTNQMRWKHQGEEWLCKRITGDVWCRRADGATGKLYLVCQLEMDAEGNAQVWPPEGGLLKALRNEDVPTSSIVDDWSDFPQGLLANWRLCLNRTLRAWRIRDEAFPEKIWNTNGYRGIVHMTWWDNGPHVHAYQPARIDSNGVVQFGG